MKKRQFLATILAVIMVLALATTSASASSRLWYDPEIPDPGLPDFGNTEVLIPELVLNVSVDDVIIPGVNVYQGLDGNFRVYSYKEFEKIFTTERYYALTPYIPRDGIILDYYINLFGYTAEVSNNTLCIYTAGSNKIKTFEVYTNNVYSGTTNNPLALTIPNNGQIIYSGSRIYINNDGNQPVEIFVNGNLVNFPDQQPIIMKPGRTMVPIRAIAELLGCKVAWNSEFNCAVITRNSLVMYLFPGKTTYLFNGQYYDMDVAPTVIRGRTMVPLRFVAEAFGFKVSFQSGPVGTVSLD